jgi:septal ring factor EnvC (AmiA/AmiB activator)
VWFSSGVSSLFQEISNAQMVLEARLDGLQGDLGATNRAVATTNRELVQTNADVTYLNNKVLQLEFQLNQLLQFKRSFMPGRNLFIIFRQLQFRSVHDFFSVFFEKWNLIGLVGILS